MRIGIYASIHIIMFMGQPHGTHPRRARRGGCGRHWRAVGDVDALRSGPATSRGSGYCHCA
eukprot:5677841-Pleurochrysis_carterae.AAC.2